MDILSLMRTLGALAVVLGLLWGALWAVKRYNFTLGGRFAVPGSATRLRVVERTGLDAKHAAVLLRRDGREHLVILSPDGNIVVESYDAPPEPEITASADQPAAPDFATILAEKLKSSPLAARFAKSTRGFAFRSGAPDTGTPAGAAAEPAAVLALPPPLADAKPVPPTKAVPTTNAAKVLAPRRKAPPGKTATARTAPVKGAAKARNAAEPKAARDA